MTLEDFEKSLSESRKSKHHHHRHHHRETTEHGERTRKGLDHHHKHRHRSVEDEHRHKRSRHSKSRDGDSNEEQMLVGNAGSGIYKSPPEDDEEWVEKDVATISTDAERHSMRSPGVQAELKRDSWMEAPSALEIDYTQKGYKKPTEPTTSKSSKVDFELKIHENELNRHHLEALADGKDVPDKVASEPAQHEVDYIFGDEGAQWRMTKLKAVFRQAEETGNTVDDIAMERFGDLRAFDDAREEQIELERRETYGKGYVGKEKPTGELFQQRNLDPGVRSNRSLPNQDDIGAEDLPRAIKTETPPATTVQLDQTALNRLKAQMLKAKLRGSSDAAVLEAEYENAITSSAARQEPNTVVLGAMESRMLAGGRKGEVQAVNNKRGRERGLVEENEDMSIEDMVREERRTRNQAGGDGKRFAERIAKDGKFDVTKSIFAKGRHLLTVYRMIWITWMETPPNWRNGFKSRR